MGYITVLRDTVDKNISVYGDRFIFKYSSGPSDYRLTFWEYKSVLQNIKDILTKLNIEKGDRVAGFSKTTESYMALCVALSYFGVVLVPVDYNLPAETKNEILRTAKIKTLFSEPEFLTGIDTLNISVCRIDRCCKYTVIKEYDTQPEYEKSHGDVNAIMFSSGTTGRIKGIEVTYKGTVMSVERLHRYTHDTYKDVYLNVLPMSHIAGYMTALSVFWEGGCNCFLDSFSPGALVNGFSTYKPSLFEMVPEVYELMKSKALRVIDSSGFIKKYYRFSTGAVRYCRMNLNFNPKFLTRPIYKKIFGPRMRCLGVGAAPMSEETLRFYMDLGMEFVNAYGSTETNLPICALDGKGRYEYKGVGNCVRDEAVQIRINNPDSNGIGEIYVKSELMMRGYFEDPELTLEAYDGEWFKTGDAGYIDSENNLYIKGRIKENIVLSNGEKVTPAEIDNYYSLTDVKIASVGVMTEKGFDEIHLFIESRNAELAKIINEKMYTAPKNYKIKDIHFIDKIPVTSTGKIKRYELKGKV